MYYSPLVVVLFLNSEESCPSLSGIDIKANYCCTTSMGKRTYHEVIAGISSPEFYYHIIILSNNKSFPYQ